MTSVLGKRTAGDGAEPPRSGSDDDDGDGPTVVAAEDLPPQAASPTAPQHPFKVPRLEDDRVAAPGGVGANLVEMDGKSCTHDVAWPPGQPPGSLAPPPKRPGPPAREYPFKIDPFQQIAVNALESGHSVLVAAHTSAGKTVVAEYAFAMALRDKARVVYTSPLKALSNQKYREFQDEFRDVGLMTGDVTINPSASCLVMTTEILRSMLYRGSEVVREVALVVYDEIHYIRDKERGVVWEESIIMMPKTARFAFLSATIPNAKEFAEWVAKVHGSPCHVVYTDYRPTPLQHYVFPQGSDGLFMVVDEKGTFRDDNFQRAVAQLNDVDGSGGKGKKKGAQVQGGGPAEKSDAYKIVKMIMERNYDPVIVFSFSKKECEARAAEMQALDLTDEDEKKLIDSIYTNAMDCLSPEDQRLPQISALLPMLKRGIGVHHAGLLPIVKEAVEILFGEGLLRALFATETFSTGLNMPAKTVVFTSARKFDGGGSRWVTSGEYIQMSGRAGRRGLDDRGVVILMLSAKMEPAVARDMIKGAPDVMYSAFHLEYAMILNLMRAEGADPAALMQRSFKQFQVERSLPRLQARVARLAAERDAVAVPDEELVTGYLALLSQYAALANALRAALQEPRASLPFLTPGRLIRVLPEPPPPKDGLPNYGALQAPLPPADGAGPEEVTARGVVAAVSPGVWGAVVNFERLGKRSTDGRAAGDDEEGDEDEKKQRKNGGKAGPSGAEKWIVDVLVNGEAGWNGSTVETLADGRQRLRITRASKPGTPHVVSFPLTHVDALSSVRVYINKDLRPLEARQQSIRTIGEALVRLVAAHGGVPLLDLQQDLKVEGKAVRKLGSKLEQVEKELRKHPLAALDDGELQGRLAAAQRKAALEEAVAVARREARAATGLIMKEELRARQRVLRRLGYVTDEGVVTMKGQLAAQINTADTLVLVEMVFNGVFSPLNPEQLAAVCSCFTWREKSESTPKMRDELHGAWTSLKEAARRVAKVEQDAKLPDALDPDDYVSQFRPDLMEPVAAWVRGVPFKSMRDLTTVFEGSLVRAMRRLEELLRQVAAALLTVGERELGARFEAAGTRLKRGVVFAASLYL